MENKPVSVSVRKNPSINCAALLSSSCKERSPTTSPERNFRDRGEVPSEKILGSNARKRAYPFEREEFSSKIRKPHTGENILPASMRSGKAGEIKNDENDENSNTQDFVRMVGASSSTNKQINQGSKNKPAVLRTNINLIDQKSLVLKKVLKQKNHTSSVNTHRRLENKENQYKKISSKPSSQKESDNKEISLICNIFNSFNPNEANKESYTRVPLKAIQDNCGNKKNNVSRTKGNCQKFKSVNRDRKESQNFQDYKHTDDSFVATKQTLTDTNNTSSRSNFQKTGKDKIENITLNKNQTVKEYFKMLSLFNIDEGKTEDGNDDYNFQSNKKFTKLTNNRNWKETGKNVEISSVGIGFSGLSDEKKLFKKPCIRNKNVSNRFTKNQEEEYFDSLFSDAKKLYKPIPQKPTLKSIENSRQIDIRTEHKPTQSNAKSESLKETNLTMLSYLDSSDEESSQATFNNTICKKKTGRSMQIQSENKSNKDLESRGGEKQDESQYKKISSKPSSQKESDDKEISLICDIFDSFNPNEANKEIYTRVPLKAIQDNCGNKKNNVSRTKGNCQKFKSVNRDRKESQNFQDYKHADDSFVVTKQTLADTNKTSSRSNFQKTGKDKIENITLTKNQTVEEYFKILSLFNIDEGKKNDGNDDYNFQSNKKCTKLTNDRNWKGTGKNVETSSVGIGFSGLSDEKKLFKKPCNRNKNVSNRFTKNQEEEYFDSLFSDAKNLYKPIPQKPTLKSVDNSRQIDIRTEHKPTQSTEKSESPKETKLMKLSYTDSSDEESSQVTFKNTICKKKTGISMQIQSENKSNKDLESRGGEKQDEQYLSQCPISWSTDSGLCESKNKPENQNHFSSSQNNVDVPRKDTNTENNLVTQVRSTVNNSEDTDLTICSFLPELDSSNFLSQSNKPVDVRLEIENDVEDRTIIHDTNNISDPNQHLPCRKANVLHHNRPEMPVNKEVASYLRDCDFLQNFHVEEVEEDRRIVFDIAKDGNRDVADLDYNARIEKQDSSNIESIINFEAKETEQFGDSKSSQLLFPQSIRKRHPPNQGSESDEEIYSQLFNMNDLNAIINDIDESSCLTDTRRTSNNFNSNRNSFSIEICTSSDARKIIKRYRKNNVKIFKILKQKRKYKSKKLKSRRNQKKFDRMLEMLSKGESTNIYDTSETETDLDTTRPSSCFTVETRSEVLSTGSSDGLTKPQMNLRQGINFASKNKSLLYDWTDDNFFDKADKREVIQKIRQIFMQVYSDVSRNNSPTLQFRRHSLDNCIFKDDRLQLKPGIKGKMSQIGTKRFYLVLYLLKRILELLKSDKIITKRELYYEVKTIVKQSCLIYSSLNVVTSLLDVGPWSLNICCQKGLVYGDLSIYFSSGEVLDCKPRGVLIPQDLSEIEHIRSNAFFILVVEKEAIFNKLLQDGLPDKFTRPLIMITGKGFPDLGTQIFLKKLWMILSIPVFILVDGDPDGINIMLNYRYGSKNNAHISHYLAVPKAQWLGILPSEMGALAIETEKLTDREIKLCKRLIMSPYIDGNKKIADELKILLKNGRKVGIEGLIKSELFLINTYLPTKLCNQHYI